ncbi:MAG: hypothetical protein OEY56_12915 [Cyclobacteriaceae bacterium]|nr:hypothetical protein [Cyclobacteriaceae bacterium]
MGHEFVHAYQYASLAGVSESFLMRNPYIVDEIMEHHAYTYESYVLGNANAASRMLSPSNVLFYTNQYPVFFDQLDYMNFPGLFGGQFKYPF